LRLPITILICATIVGTPVTVAAATTPTITVYTEPPELEIWVDGERLGVGEVVLFGPFDDYVEVTVKGKGYKDNDKVIKSPGSGERNLVIVIAGEKKRGFSWKALGIGLAVVLGPFCLIFAGGL
jgi:hypothetical protein